MAASVALGVGQAARMEHVRVLARVARRALKDDDMYHLAESLVRRMENLDSQGDRFAGYAVCVVELITAAPKQLGVTGTT